MILREFKHGIGEKWLFNEFYCVIMKNEINKDKIKKDNFNILKMKKDVKKKIILIRKRN